MIKCEAIEKFTLKEFDKLKNIQRRNLTTEGTIYVGDTFECDQIMATYLTGGNAKNKTVVKIIEVMPEELEMPKLPVEEKPKKSYYKKKSDKK